MSAGVTYCVPEIHWMFDIVGRGGTIRSGLYSVSFDRFLAGSASSHRVGHVQH
jgi:hypothetical protein